MPAHPEPTATPPPNGPPIRGAIEGDGLDGVAVLVTRWARRGGAAASCTAGCGFGAVDGRAAAAPAPPHPPSPIP
jgi:hypothetical protein